VASDAPHHLHNLYINSHEEKKKNPHSTITMVWHSKMSVFCKKSKMYTFHVVTSFTIHTSSWLLIACNNSNVVYLGSCTSPNNLMNLTPPTSSPIQSSKSEMEKWKNKFHRKKLVRKKTKLVIPIEKNYSYDKINCERKWKR
jgi:hypothetical protein